MARELLLSRNVVMIAYEQLLAEGYLVARPGAGTFAAPELPQLFTIAGASTGKGEPARQIPVKFSAYVRRIAQDTMGYQFTWVPKRKVLPYDFRYGRPSLVDFPYETWCRVLAKRARVASLSDLDYGPPEGVASLRETIAEYLARTRAVRCGPEQVIITNGSQQALDLVARALIDPGDLVLLEEPHYRPARIVMKAAGAKVQTIPVDGHGLCTSQLAVQQSGCRLVIVTPSHQYPTGAVMPLARRLELLAWSKREKAIIFEDDYDSEYRYSGRPIEALQALDDHGAIFYAGTFSKVMFPALRLGYLVVPEPHVEPFRTIKGLADTGNPSLPQLALVDFIRSGLLERHLHRQRVRNAARRAALVEAIDHYLGDQAEVSGVEAGLHILLWLRKVSPGNVEDLRKSAEKMGVGVYSVAPYYSTPPPQAGLLMGYGTLSEKEITEGVRRLASVLRTQWGRDET